MVSEVFAIARWITTIDWNLLGMFFSAILGAIVGGLFTYKLTLHLDYVRRNETSARLHTALIREMITHQTTLTGDLDVVLPLWIRRGDSQVWNEDQMKKSPIVFRYLSTHIYNEFRHELLCSDLAVPVAHYYSEVVRINETTKAIEQGKNSDYISNIRNMVDLFSENLYLTSGLIEATPPMYLRPVSIVKHIDNFKNNEKSNRILIAVANHSYSDLKKYKRNFEYGDIKSIPHPLNESRNWINWVKSAEDIGPHPYVYNNI